jgi:DNA repair exonuclease SbcCD ATPase subunit
LEHWSALVGERLAHQPVSFSNACVVAPRAESGYLGTMAQALGRDYVDLTQLPSVLQQLNLTTREMQALQKNTQTQVSALKHEFDESVRASGTKARELDKTNIETKKALGDVGKQIAKLTEKMVAADGMVDAVKESTRKVKSQEQRVVKIEGEIKGHSQQFEVLAEFQKLAKDTRKDTDDLIRRMEASEAHREELASLVAEAQARADAAHDRADALKEELDYERDERSRIEDEHSMKMENLQKDLALLVNALGGHAHLKVEDFVSIKPAKSAKGALDVTDTRIRRLDESQGRLVAEFQRVEDLEVRLESSVKDLKQAQGRIKTITETESEVALRLNSFEKWKNKIELKIEDIDHSIQETRASAEAGAQPSAAPFDEFSPPESSRPAVTGESKVQPEASSKATPAHVSQRVVGGVKQEDLREMEIELKGQISGLDSTLQAFQEEMQGLSSQLKALEIRFFEMESKSDVRKKSPENFDEPQTEGLQLSLGQSAQADDPSIRVDGISNDVRRQETALVSNGVKETEVDAEKNIQKDAVDLGKDPSDDVKPMDNEKDGEAPVLTESTNLGEPRMKGTSKLNIPERPSSQGLLRRQVSIKQVPAPPLTNQQIVQQQGETFILMYNEIAHLRKEIRAIRSSNRPSLLAGVRKFSPWALRDPFRILEKNQEICVFPDGTDRDVDYGWMPVAARNMLSDPDVEQFMRDSIYMLHREMSTMRKDVDKFKLEGDPAMLAAMQAMDDAKKALSSCTSLLQRLETVEKTFERKLDQMNEIMHYNRHDMIERLSKVRQEQNSDKFAAIDLEFTRLHTDVTNTMKTLQDTTAEQNDSLKGLKNRLKSVEQLSGVMETSVRESAQAWGMNLKQSVEVLNKRVDGLDKILMERVKEKQAREMETALKTKYAYSFDFSASKKDIPAATASTVLPARIMADEVPPTRLFDVQRLELYSGGSGAPKKRPASARVLRARPQSAHVHQPFDKNERDRGGKTSAEHVEDVHRYADHVMASVLPGRTGRGWTRSGHPMPPDRKRAHDNTQEVEISYQNPLLSQGVSREYTLSFSLVPCALHKTYCCIKSAQDLLLKIEQLFPPACSHFESNILADESLKNNSRYPSKLASRLSRQCRQQIPCEQP